MKLPKGKRDWSMAKGEREESAARKPGHFEICREMAKRNMDIRMSLLENVTNVRYSDRTKGTTVSIGIDGNLVAAIALDHKFIGGLLLCDREQYFAIEKELSEEIANAKTS